MSPLQLFTEGLCEMAAADHAYSVNQAPIFYLTDSEATWSLERDVTAVEVPSNLFAPCNQLPGELQSSINPLSECSDIGQRYYMTAIQLAGHHLANCANCQMN